ncbi:urease subunit gamma [Lentibacillus sp. Marseille-P4043]|uniref:urease subunit gamma n=1 Tax=Lentibacillus sp. Marseille-P4043 TaxID=2040293 RepID=UPI000D0B36B8|nr:urease subunit gamma [Lentibacillus sp. Marseille-P4043]
MHLTEREKESLLIVTAAWLAKERLAKGMKLSYPETVALITYEVMEAARTGNYSVSDLHVYGKNILSEDQVMEGVPSMISKLNIQATFPDGTKLVVVYNPFKPVKQKKLEIGEHYYEEEKKKE